jgi:Pentapeptide repeats (9 copies)
MLDRSRCLDDAGGMTDQTGIDWPTCGEDGCMGVRLAATPKCLAHAGDDQRNAMLKQLGETGVIDARGVPITEALLEQILAAAPHDADNPPTFTAPRFGRATFQGEAGFGGATFQSNAEFDSATFRRDAQFGGATFQHDSTFDSATFQGNAGFDRTTFHHDATFDRTTFQRNAWFDRATFQGGAWFAGATFQGNAGFYRATFELAQRVGPLLAYRGLQLNDAQFAQPVQIEASTIGVCCRRARFAGGVQFRLRWARVLLDDADLAAPSIIAGIPRLTGDLLAEREQRIAKAWQRLLGGAVSEQPRLLSLRRANVAGLGLASVELADCRFAGAHNLDKLRLEADVSFGSAPVRLGWDWRQVIAEERAWRAHRSGRWTNPVWPAWADDEPAVLEAGQIAGLYRALRKGREDAKDEPGATDFYYGEMEMRRRARRGHGNAQSHSRTGERSRGRVERGILTAYWLVSATACGPGERWPAWSLLSSWPPSACARSGSRTTATRGARPSSTRPERLPIW